MRIHQGGSGPLVPVIIVTTIVNAHDQTVSSDRWVLAVDRFDQNRAADLSARVRLDGFEPGEYLLVTTAITDKDELTRHIRISVR